MRVRAGCRALSIRAVRAAGLVTAVVALTATGLLPPAAGGASALAATEPVVTRTPLADVLFNRTTPGGGEDRNVSNQVVELVRSATPGSTIRVSAFRFNDAEVSDALVDAASTRGVKVFVATNDLEPGSRWTDIAPTLRRAGGGITYCGHSCVKKGGINHDKFWLLSSVQYARESAPRTDVVLDTSQNMSLGQANELNNAWVRYGDVALYAGFVSRFASMYAQQATFRTDVSSGVAADADGDRITVRFSPRWTASDFVAADVRAVPCATTSVIRITGSIFTNRPELRDALVARRRCGVAVSAVLRDDMTGEDDQASFDELGAGGIPIASSRPGGCRKPTYCGTGLVHSKLLLLEYTSGGKAHRVVYTGSHNWTRGSLTSSDETSVRFRWQGPPDQVGTSATALYDIYSRYFQQLWDDARDLRPSVYGADAAHYSEPGHDPATDQHASVTAASRSGRSIVVWEQQPSSAAGQALTQIYARTYLHGAPEGPACPLSATGAGQTWSDVEASAGMDDAGNAVVAWREDADGDGAGDIAVVRVDNGTYSTCPQVTALAPPQAPDAADESAPSVAVNGRGDYAIAWQADVGGQAGIRASRYVRADDGSFTVVPGLDRADVSGLPGGTGAHPRSGPAAGMSDDGTVSVVWPEDLGGDAPSTIELRRFGADGEDLGPPVHVSSQAGREQTRPDIAVGAVGRAVIAWQELPSATAPGSDSRVLLRTVEPDGTLRGADSPAAGCMPGAFACGQAQPDVAIADDGTFVVAWREDEPWVRLAEAPDTRRVRGDVWARGFPWDAAQPDGGVLPLYRMNLFTANEQDQPSLAVQPDDRSLLLAYTDDFDSETGGPGQLALRASFRT